MMYYIVINNKVVSNSSGIPREFPKRKKAENFAEGRRLDDYEIVTDITNIEGRLKISL